MSKLLVRDKVIAQIHDLLNSEYGKTSHSVPIEFLWLLNHKVLDKLSLSRLNVILATLQLLVKAISSSRLYSNRLREISDETRKLV